MMIKRIDVLGLVGGLVLALVGPAGIAVGHFSHPVGEVSHPEAGAVFGTVTDADTGVPLEGVCVSIERNWGVQPFGHGSGLPDYSYGQTDQDGHYFSRALRPGLYVVEFDPNCSTSLVRNRYAAEWADGARRLIDAQHFRISKTQTTIVDADLDRAGIITGSVVDDIGDNPSTCVSAYLDDTDPFDVRWPDAVSHKDDELVVTSRVEDGSFRIRGLGTGNYRLLVGCLGAYGPQEAPAPFGYVPSWASVVTLPSGGAEIEASPVTLTRAGSISGTVVDQFGRDQANACVDAWKSSSRPVGASFTTASGSYEGARLAPGSYRVSANQYWCSSPSTWSEDPTPSPVPIYSHYWQTPRFERTWFDDSPTFGAASPVSVDAGRSTRVDLMVRLLGSDLNVAKLEVTDPTVKTALLEAPAIGVRKDIRVTIREDGILRPSYWYPSSLDRTTEARLVVWAQSLNPRMSQKDVIYTEDFELAEGGSKLVSISWTPLRSLGDIAIHAKTCVLRNDPWYYQSPTDIFTSNNLRSQETYVGVGGLGGASFAEFRSSSFPNC